MRTASVLALSVGVVAQPSNDTALVQEHVANNANATWREPQGYLKYPYLVPAGPYNQLWDWDSVFLGVATVSYGSGPYFKGSMLNFLDHTNLTDGSLPGCLTPSGATPTLYQAKPIIIQGSYLAAKATGDFASFQAFEPQMQALLAWWNATAVADLPRGPFDAATQLHTWYDQLSTGADNLVYSQCPSEYSPCWDASADAFTLASPDVMTFMYRERIAYARFLAMWSTGAPDVTDDALRTMPVAVAAKVRTQLSAAAALRDALNEYLWHWQDAQQTAGFFAAWNVSTGTRILRRTYQVVWPLWANLTANASQASAALNAVMDADLFSAFGVRSASSNDPQYNNDNIINPYSNWRGPVWVNVNAVIAYTLRAFGRARDAAAVADAVVHTLAQDLRTNGTWHECYDAETGAGLAAPGFLSWDTLGATLQANVAAGVDPFSLD